MKQFSVIIPVYNTEQYLRECLGSVLTYKGEELEVIALDDGSTDGSLALLSTFSDPRLKVFHHENMGVYKTWKRGVELCEGEYIVFLDSDDSLKEGLFPFLNSILDEYRPDLIQYGWTEVEENGQTRDRTAADVREGYFEGAELRALVEEKMLFLGTDRSGFSTLRWAKAFRTELLRAVLPDTIENICMYEDDSITRPFFTQIRSLYVTRRSFYNNRYRTGGSICSSPEKLSAHFEDCKNLISYFYDTKERFGYPEKTLRYYYVFYYTALLGDAVCAKDLPLIKRILADERLRELMKEESGIKIFLLRRRMFRLYRLMRKIKRALR